MRGATIVDAHEHDRAVCVCGFEPDVVRRATRLMNPLVEQLALLAQLLNINLSLDSVCCAAADQVLLLVHEEGIQRILAAKIAVPLRVPLAFVLVVVHRRRHARPDALLQEAHGCSSAASNVPQSCYAHMTKAMERRPDALSCPRAHATCTGIAYQVSGEEQRTTSTGKKGSTGRALGTALKPVIIDRVIT